MAEKKPIGCARPTGGPALARGRAALTNQPIAYRATLNGDAAERYAPQANIPLGATLPANIGLLLEGEVWPDRTRLIGLDLRARVGALRLGFGPEKRTFVPWGVDGGVRYKAWTSGDWSAEVGAGAGAMSEFVVAYADPGRTTPELVPFTLAGARLGGGLRGELGRGLVVADLQTFWTPLPSVARLDVRADIPLTEPLLLTLGTGLEGRAARFRPESPEDARVNVLRGAIDIRVGIAVAAF